jgi:hypothetical protein
MESSMIVPTMDRSFITAISRLTTVPEVCGALQAAFPTVGYIPRFVDWAFSGSVIPFDIAAFTPTDRLFVDAILAHKAHRLQASQSRVLELGLDHDVIGREPLIDYWSIPKLVCYLVAQQQIPTLGCAAVVGMRDEGATSIEWIAHYKAIGVDRIFVYTNNNSDGTDRILERLAEQDEIVLIRNAMASDVYPQFKIYEHFLLMLPEARDYKWCCFFDSDEFFVPDQSFHCNVQELLDHVDREQPNAGAIWYPWRWVVSDNCFDREPGTLAQRFRHAWKHSLVKSIARMADIIGMKPLHSPFLREDCFPIDASLTRRAMTDLFEEKDWPETTGILHHYWCKSFQEFYMKKRRGDSINLNANAYQRDLDLFFAWNGTSANRPECPVPVEVISAAACQHERLLSLSGVADAVVAAQATFRTLVATDPTGKPLLDTYNELLTTTVVTV